ncbi:MAG: hypothetical protein JRJ87_08590 [Deltaproteobacteria bacterium]|nr:hypothetical protein [Deltaproteobacteria bacterium]
MQSTSDRPKKTKTVSRKVLVWVLGLVIVSAGCNSAEKLAEPVPDIAAATRAFKLYYKERVDRVLVAYNRFMLFGDVGFGVTMGKAGIAKQGNDFEVVPGPTDNNKIGLSTWTTWQAYRLFGTRTLELSLLRMFNGLHFFEAISGHPGLTSRMVYPGWTRLVDGQAKTVSRTRAGVEVSATEAYSPELIDELIETFYSGVRITYREDPEDFLFNYMPAVEVGPYAVTYSFSALPKYLRSSDCCCSLMRTPEGFAWEGAYWGNHNSRDNFPDLSLGIVAAMQAMDDESVSSELRQAAGRVVEAGQRIGDLIITHDAIMTVDEHNPYDYFINSGAVRPDGETEIEDLGTLADCQMAYLSRAISSEGLSLPLPKVKAPSSIEYILVDVFGQDVSCEVAPQGRTCARLEEAFCGEDWDSMEEMTVFGVPWLELVRDLDQSSPGVAEDLIGGFQDDFYEISLAVTALVLYADVKRETELAVKARKVLGDLADLMRLFADIIYTQTQPDRLAMRMYQAALFDGWGGLESIPLVDLADFTIAESQIAYIESWLEMQDTQPAALLTDEEILDRVASHLEGRSETVKLRYQDAYGDTPPIRRSPDGYEARGVPAAEHPWQPVQRPHHKIVGGVRLLHALPLCVTAPMILDCTWAALGCARPDFNKDGLVDSADTDLFETQRAAFAGEDCRSNNQWCQGADLDRTGTVDDRDSAFIEAAQDCHYQPENKED